MEENRDEAQKWGIGSFLVVLVVLAAIIFIIYVFASNLNKNSSKAKTVELNKKLDSTYAKTSDKAQDKIALISVKTIIDDSIVDSITAKLRAAREDEDIKAIILEVDSPGGGVYASNSIWNEVMKVKVSSKPVVAFFNGLAASGGYYIAAPADKIVAAPCTITGSIGVITQAMNYSELMKKIGVKKLVFKSGRYKDMLSSHRPVTEEEERIVQDLIMKIRERFIKVVSEGRKMDEVKVRKLADDALIYLAEDALELGLIDQIGYLEDAFEAAKKLAKLETASLVRYEMEKSLVSGFYEKIERLQETISGLFHPRSQFQFYFL